MEPLAGIPPERHLLDRIGWLRAAVMGANDGIVSTASLIVGVAAAASTKQEVIVAGVAGLVAGALSMAAGEYVSVSSQADTEAADLARERREQIDQPEFELAELTQIYQQRGLDAELAGKVAVALMEHDAEGAHARDELGLGEALRARPLMAALASSLTFSVGAALPLIAALMLPLQSMPLWVSLAALVALMFLGAVGAKVGGAPVGKGVLRVAFWGALAMAATFAIGSLLGTSVG
jgi:vacuolar iron transporter family protein